MPTTTTTYSFNKPVVGADEDDWGGYLNGNWDSVDDLLDGTTPVTGIDINSGTLDGVTIGGTTAGAGTFTTLTANTSITGTLATAAQPNITSVGSLTSLDVAGTLTSDGLTVDQTSGYLRLQDLNTTVVDGTDMGGIEWRTGDSSVSGANRITAKISVEGAGGFTGSDVAPSRMILSTHAASGVDPVDRIKIDYNGDISFYEDTGTTAKFFWDASAERLGIGNSSPATALDVTGTITSDGLTVDGPFTVFNNTGISEIYDFKSDHYTQIQITSDVDASAGGPYTVQLVGNGNNGNLELRTNTVTRQSVAQNGDISFYEDTGTTAKFFWDASAESLGIGTSSPATNLEIRNASAPATLKMVQSGAGQFTITTESGLTTLAVPDTGGGLAFGTGTGGTERMRIDSSGNVDIGSTGGGVKLAVAGAVGPQNGTAAAPTHTFYSDTNTGMFRATVDTLGFSTAGSERMRIDSSGNLLVGTTDNTPYNNSAGSTADNGIALGSTGIISSAKYNDATINLNRTGTDGDIAVFRKDGTTVGSIGTSLQSSVRYMHIAGTATGLGFYSNGIFPSNSSGIFADNSKDLGSGTVRWDDVYATNGTIQTSDRNEKQDIAELTDAEQRVAVAAKGLLRKFRWRDAVEEKGDEARTHFGIIAQDLQAAFEAEGLDAGDYAMFIHSTWTDEETGEERSRMGVRYSELLAFIIAAI